MLKAYVELAGSSAKINLHKVNIYDPPKIEKDEETEEETEIPWELERVEIHQTEINNQTISGLDYFLQIQSPYIYPLLSKENGVNTFQRSSDKTYCWIRVIDYDMKAFIPPEDLENWNDRKADKKRRSIDFNTDILKDPLAGKNINTHGNTSKAIADVINILLENDSWNLLNEKDLEEDDEYF